MAGRVALFISIEREQNSESFAHAVVSELLQHQEDQFWEDAVAALSHESDDAREGARRVLGKSPSRVLQAYSSKIVCLLKDGCQNIRSTAAKLIVSRPCELMHARGVFPLHVAAKAGHLDVCKKLVCAGASIRRKNQGRERPSQLALQHGHQEVHDFFSSMRRKINVGLCGIGDAFEAAMSDLRPVIGVRWYTVGLQGLFGQFGASHSLLAITVGDLERQPHTYVVEKAFELHGWLGAGQRSQQFLNGIYISHWIDITFKVGGEEPLYQLQQDDIPVPRRIRDLRQMALELGPYSVSSANCHHAAQTMYNACAALHAQVPQIPNRLLVGMTRMFACHPNQFRSTLESNPTHFRVTLHSNPPMPYDGSNIARSGATQIFNHELALPAVRLAQWIYRVMSETVTIHNMTEQTVVLYSENARQEIRILPFRDGEIKIQGESGWVRINYVGFLGRTSIRTRLKRVEFHRVSDYWLQSASSEDIECISGSILPDSAQEVERYLAGPGGNAVQWGIVIIEDVIYVTFRGTVTKFDAITDSFCIPCYDTDHGLAVHSAAHTQLHQQPHHVVSMVAEHIRRLRTASAPNYLRVVLVGHSLGGAYALLTGLHLLNQNIDVTKVITFGAPQVVVPDPDNRIWQKMNEITSLYVNRYDAIPRLPSCEQWVFETIPRCGVFRKSLGALTIDCERKISEFVADIVRPAWPKLQEFDTVGTVLVIMAGSRTAHVYPNLLDGRHRFELECRPQHPSTKIIEDHFVMNYEYVIRGLDASTPMVESRFAFSALVPLPAGAVPPILPTHVADSQMSSGVVPSSPRSDCSFTSFCDWPFELDSP